MTRAEAESIIASLVKLRESATDEQAAKAPHLYKTWMPGLAVKAGDRLYYPDTDRLYKVVSDHATQADWTPDAVPALYTVIDVAHAGTKEDPIPWAQNMALYKDKYYTQNNVLYLCIRDSGNPLTYDLNALIGLYVQVVGEVE